MVLSFTVPSSVDYATRYATEFVGSYVPSFGDNEYMYVVSQTEYEHSVNFEVPSPMTVETDVAMDAKSAECVGKPSTGPKVTVCEYPKICKRIETRSIQRERKKDRVGRRRVG